jgi:hypothetical protein
VTTVFIITAILLYFLPSIVAISRSVPNAGSVVVLNLFLGWTFIGWIASLAMSFGSTRPIHQVNVNVSPPPYEAARHSAPQKQGYRPPVGPTAYGPPPCWPEPLQNRYPSPPQHRYPPPALSQFHPHPGYPARPQHR